MSLANRKVFSVRDTFLGLDSVHGGTQVTVICFVCDTECLGFLACRCDFRLGVDFFSFPLFVFFCLFSADVWWRVDVPWACREFLLRV